MVTWAGTDRQLTPDLLLSKPNVPPGRPDNEREFAKRFLSDFLDDGPQPRSKIYRVAEARSISSMTLRRAADDLGVSKQRDGKNTVWALGRS